MSNEKLGAEQGRVTPKGAENVCPVCYHDFADCPCPFEVKPAEQAYHARGAGREAEALAQALYDGAECNVLDDYRRIIAKWLAEREPGADTGTTGAEGLSGMLAQRMIKLAIKIQGPYATFGPPESLARRKKSHEERIEELTGMLTTEFAECLEAVLARSADTGTTPPPLTAEFEPLLRGELKHGRSCPAVGAPMDEGNCDCGLKWRIRLQTEMTLRNAWEKRTYEAEAALAAAEGLTLYDILNTKAFNGSMHQAKQIADEINAKLAATQRAPVEQGRGATKVIADLRRALEQVRKEAGGKQDYALSNCYNIADTILRRAPWGDVTAPDHAREGASRPSLP